MSNDERRISQEFLSKLPPTDPSKTIKWRRYAPVGPPEKMVPPEAWADDFIRVTKQRTMEGQIIPFIPPELWGKVCWRTIDPHNGEDGLVSWIVRGTKSTAKGWTAFNTVIGGEAGGG